MSKQNHHTDDALATFRTSLDHLNQRYTAQLETCHRTQTILANITPAKSPRLYQVYSDQLARQTRAAQLTADAIAEIKQQAPELF